LGKSPAATFNMARHAGLIVGTLMDGWLSPTMGFCAAAATMTTSAVLLLSETEKVLHNA
jgi:hypothetical protein